MLLRELLGRRRAEAELDAEIAMHLEMAVDELRAEGLSEEDARREAKRR